MEIMKGAEPISLQGKGDDGILLVHGFTSTPDSMSYLAKRFSEKGFHVEVPLHPGHGTNWKDLNRVKYRQWTTGLELAYEKLSERAKNTSVLGLSMGGTLAIYLAENHPELKALFLINHALFMGNPAVPISGFLKLLIKRVPAIASDIKDPETTELAYDGTPIGGIHQLYKLIKQVRPKLSEIHQPTLIFKSKEDHVLPLKNAPFTMEKISSEKKALIWLENSYHVATMDLDKDIIFEKCFEFLKSLD